MHEIQKQTYNLYYIFENYFLSASYCAIVVQKVTENTKYCHWKYFTLSSARINYISLEFKKMVWKCVFSLVVQLLFIFILIFIITVFAHIYFFW